MMSFRAHFLSIVVVLLSCQTLQATHIVGGELNYKQLSGSNYQITLTVYRDCFGGQAQFDNPASIGVFDAQGNLISSTSVTITSDQHVPNLINSPCLTPPTNICYEVATYVFTTTLPPLAGGYQLVYQRCCRNHSILNINNVNFTGATYIATIPDPALASMNSNPVFTEWPPTFICVDAPFTFDHSATDADGDSIVYEICDPLEGADQSSPMPQPPNGPPYYPVSWRSPYSMNNPFGGAPLNINPVTGRLTATPNAIGQYVYGVCAKEYRNGVYLGETKRDFQVNVVPCPMITVASIFSPTIVCGSLTAEFTNNSYNASTYRWEFGDNTTFGDSSNQKNPSWTYPDTGVYTATLIAYSGMSTLCNDTAVGVVKVFPIFFARFNEANVRCTPDFTFYDGSFGVGGVANFWDWDLGDGTVSSMQNPTHSYLQPGLYDVRLITSTDSSCLDTVLKTISVLQPPEALFTAELDTCTHTAMVQNTSINSANAFWNFEGVYDTIGDHVKHIYSQNGVNVIRMIAVSDSACTDTMEQIITLPPLPESDFSYFVAVCDSTVKFSNLSHNGISYTWNFGDEETSDDYSPTHTYNLSGSIPVQLISSSANACEDTITKDIYFISRKEAFFRTKLDTCNGYVRFVDVTQHAVTYNWDFGDGEKEAIAEPQHKYAKDGSYLVHLTVNGESACPDSTNRYTVFETPLGELLYVPSAFTPNGDGLNDIFRISVFRPCESYSLSIFNRWGQLVFESEDAQNAEWDGTFKNSMAEEGIYVYLLRSGSQERKGVAYLTR